MGDNNIIGPFCYIDRNTVMGDNNFLQNGVTINYGARIGNGNEFFTGASISAKPQDLKFKGEDTICQIGDNNSFRENVNISRGTASKGSTIIGNNCLLMEDSHVAHDCVIGNNIIIGNSTKFAGEVVFSMDIPPYIIAGKEPTRYCGLNLVGLRRRGFSRETIDLIHSCYRILYSKSTFAEAFEEINKQLPMTDEVKYIVDFVKESKRGIIR